MPQGPAARVTDLTAHGMPLSPGPGSPNVLIGFLPAWRAVPLAAGVALQAAKITETVTLATLASATITAAAVVPPAGLPAAQAAEMLGRSTAEAAMAAALKAASVGPMGPADTHICSMPFAAVPPDLPPSPAPPGPPHGPGVVIDGSATVLINMLPASRLGDHVLEALGPLDPIALGCMTVIIGG